MLWRVTCDHNDEEDDHDDDTHDGDGDTKTMTKTESSFIFDIIRSNRLSSDGRFIAGAKRATAPAVTTEYECESILLEFALITPRFFGQCPPPAIRKHCSPANRRYPGCQRITVNSAPAAHVWGRVSAI